MRHKSRDISYKDLIQLGFIVGSVINVELSDAATGVV